MEINREIKLSRSSFFLCLPNRGRFFAAAAAALIALSARPAAAGFACSSGGPVAIPDNNPAGTVLSLSAAPGEVVQDLSIDLNVTHTWVGDLVVTLTHVDTGASAVLIDRPGKPASSFGCNSDNYDVTLEDDGSGGSIETLCAVGLTPASPPSYVPSPGSLAVFNGDNVGGLWQVKISDNVGGDTGSFSQFCLTWNATDIEVSQIDSRDPAAAGGSFSYTIGVFNNGPFDAPEVAISGLVPSGMEVKQVALSQGSAAIFPLAAFPFSAQINASIGGLAVGQSATLELLVETLPLRVYPGLPPPASVVVELDGPAGLPSEIAAWPISFDTAAHPPVVSAEVALVDDGAAPPPGGLVTDACEPLLNAAQVNGKVALIDTVFSPLPGAPFLPPACAPNVQIANALAAGAVAVLLSDVTDNAGPVFGFAPAPPAVYPIPAALIGRSNGLALRGAGTVSAALRVDFAGVWQTAAQAIVQLPSSSGDSNDSNNISFEITTLGFDADGDNQPDVSDLCSADPAKTAPGSCGCGTADSDSDGDGVPDCNDSCSADAAKTAPGLCGCGAPDKDSDGDGKPDCSDLCPNDPAKTEPGVCGCGAADSDGNGNGIIDCQLNPEARARLSALTSSLRQLKARGKQSALKAEIAASLSLLAQLINTPGGGVAPASAGVSLAALLSGAQGSVNRALKARGKAFAKARSKALQALNKLGQGIA